MKEEYNNIENQFFQNAIKEKINDVNVIDIGSKFTDNFSKQWKTYTTGTDTSKAQLANADDQAIHNKHHPLYENASHVHMSNVPRTYTNTRTTNMLTYNPTKNNMDRKEGYAFSGATMSDDSYYTDLTTAADECNNNVLCAGINFDITSGQYSLMSMESTLKPRRGYVAYIKKPSKYGGISPHYGGRHHKDIRSTAAGAGGDPITWTLVASITPSFGYSKNNTLPNGSLSSKASSYAVPDEIAREHSIYGNIDQVREQAQKYEGVVNPSTFYCASALMSHERIHENIKFMIEAFGKN